MSNKILTIDQGTTSSRAIIFNISGDIEHISQEEYPLIYPEDGWVEIEPEVLKQSVLNTIDKVPLDDVACIGITNQRETTLIWDKTTLEPIYNAIVWQDRRTASYCDSIRNTQIEQTIKNKTGLQLDPYFSATKIKWILDNVEGAREKASQGQLSFGTVDTYLMSFLSDGAVHATDMTNASRTMLYNINTLEWDHELMQLFDIPLDMMPDVKPSNADFGSLSNVKNISVCGVLGDQQAALFGQGCLDTGESKSTYGTGCFLMTNTGAKPSFNDSGLLTTIGYSIDEDVIYALEGSIYSAGTIIQWLRDNLEFFADSADSEGLINENANSNGVQFIPAFNGLGAPYWNSDIRASFHGITRDTNKNDLTTAAFNSIAYQTLDIVNLLKGMNVDVPSLDVDGGMVANQTFVTNLCNTLNIQLNIPESTESTAKGAFYMSALGKGLIDLKQVKNQQKKQLSPSQELHNKIKNDYTDWANLVKRNLP